MRQRILIVEDEEVIRKFSRVQLTKAGYEVFEAEDGEKAILQLGQHRFDLIICDIVMPNKDGWELMKEIKTSPKTRDVPIIVLTAKNRDSDMFKAYDLGAAYYIPKPFTKAQLFYGIDQIFGEHREPQNDIDISNQYDGADESVNEGKP